MSSWKNYFSFSATERKGIFILTLILFGLIFFSFIDLEPDFNQNPNDFLSFQNEVEAFYTAKDSNRKKSYSEHQSYKRNPSKNSYAAYSEKGNFSKEIKKESSFIIEINSATAEEFQKIRGIGKVLSERILKFRTKLKGFHSINQLSDVYGVEQSLIDANIQHFKIDHSKMKLWSINNLEFKALLKHPYLNYDAVKCIFGFRNKSDSVSVNQALTCVSDSLHFKLKPYLSH